jgi:5-oxoprolinase (ATP-hydrolysing) subunit A
MVIYLNADAGELSDEPEEIYSLVGQVNVACGGHAGNADSMRRCLSLAAAHRVAVAAHPSYPDRANFGRKSLSLPDDQLAQAVMEQCRALRLIAAEVGVVVVAVKPHGALYHDANGRSQLADIVLNAAKAGLESASIAIVGPPHGELHLAAARHACAYHAEGFADRRYAAHGGLVARGNPDALITDPAACARQALQLARTGTVNTICIHSDTENFSMIARQVAAALAEMTG